MKFLIVIYSFLFSFELFAEVVKVVSVHDGDTLTVKTMKNKTLKLRLLGVDSPEIDFNGSNQGEDATQSFEYLKSLLPANSVVEIKSDGSDVHDRAIVQVFKDGIEVNREMLKSGMSFMYLIAPVDKTILSHYSKDAKYAYQNKLGVYGSDTEEPYLFRQKIKKMDGFLLVGNIETKKLYHQDSIDQVPAFLRLFFSNEESAFSRNYSF